MHIALLIKDTIMKNKHIKQNHPDLLSEIFKKTVKLF